MEELLSKKRYVCKAVSGLKINCKLIAGLTRASSDWIKTVFIDHISRFIVKYIFIYARLYVYLKYNLAYDRLHIAIPDQNRRIFLHQRNQTQPEQQMDSTCEPLAMG